MRRRTAAGIGEPPADPPGAGSRYPRSNAGPAVYAGPWGRPVRDVEAAGRVGTCCRRRVRSGRRSLLRRVAKVLVLFLRGSATRYLPWLPRALMKASTPPCPGLRLSVNG